MNCQWIELSGTIPSFKLFETEHRYTHNRLCPTTALMSQSSLAFLDINPISEGHTQVIPKCKYTHLDSETFRPGLKLLSTGLDHAKTLGDLPDEYLRDIGPVLKKVALSTGVEAYNIVQV